MKLDKPTSKERLEHVLKAINRIQSYAKNHTEASFLQDDQALDASMYQFTIIAEAISNVEKDILDRYDYPWHKVKSFRNFILHEYHAIELWVIWDTTQNLLPGLKELVERMLTKEF